MTNPYLSCSPGDLIPLPPRGGMVESAHIIDEDSILAINAALATGRPLLVRGEPGTGKSQLARAAAESLGRAFLACAVDGRTETRDLLWTMDAVARLAEAQVMGSSQGMDPREVQARIDVARFVKPGPLWWAFAWEDALAQAKVAGQTPPETPPGWTSDKGVVVLVDEMDKADASVPNGLLDALGHGRFDVAGRGPVSMSAKAPPLVVITTNEERTLPDAFLRRCLVLPLSLPEGAALETTLVQRGRAHFAAARCSDEVLRSAARVLAKDREEIRKQDLSPPGVAEYIDLLRAVVEQRASSTEQLALLLQIAKFALRKHPPEPYR